MTEKAGLSTLTILTATLPLFIAECLAAAFENFLFLTIALLSPAILFTKFLIGRRSSRPGRQPAVEATGAETAASHTLTILLVTMPLFVAECLAAAFGNLLFLTIAVLSPVILLARYLVYRRSPRLRRPTPATADRADVPSPPPASPVAAPVAETGKAGPSTLTILTATLPLFVAECLAAAFGNLLLLTIAVLSPVILLARFLVARRSSRPRRSGRRSPRRSRDVARFGRPENRTAARRRGIDPAAGLTIYVVLLLAVPSNVTIGALGSYGRLALLWGLVLLAWWVLSRLQYRVVEARVLAQPVRHAFGFFLVIVLVSFAAAMFRGQPADQVSPAIAAVVRVASWGGVLLVAIDGVRTIEDIAKLARRLAVAGGILAALGLLQSITRQTYLDFFSLIPGLTDGSEGIGDRGAFARATGTATHPLEFAVSIIGLLPIALAAASTGGFHHDGRLRLQWWLPPILIMVTSLVAVSRSAIIGLVVAVVASMTFLPRHYRWAVLGAAVAALATITVLVPGLFSTLIYLFTGASDDSSTQSRTDALARVPEFFSSSPIFGVGFGTFLPRYYIFDNQFVLLLIELGVLGVIAFAGIFLTALWSTLRAARISRRPDTRRFSLMIAASLVSIIVLFAFFDALSFPIAAGLFFLVVGFCASMRTIGEADAALAAAASMHFPRSESSRWRRRPRIRWSATDAGRPRGDRPRLGGAAVPAQLGEEGDEVGAKPVKAVPAENRP